MIGERETNLKSKKRHNSDIELEQGFPKKENFIAYYPGDKKESVQHDFVYDTEELKKSSLDIDDIKNIIGNKSICSEDKLNAIKNWQFYHQNEIDAKKWTGSNVNPLIPITDKDIKNGITLEEDDDEYNNDKKDPSKFDYPLKDNNPQQEINEWKLKKFKEYTDRMYNIFKAKNSDYTASEGIGSAFDVTYDLIGPTAPAIRFMDKVLRYISLTSGKKQMVQDEKVEDTLIDLANYALLTLLKIESDKKFKNE